MNPNSCSAPGSATCLRQGTGPTATAPTWIPPQFHVSPAPLGSSVLKSALDDPVLFEFFFFPQEVTSTIFVIHVPEKF